MSIDHYENFPVASLLLPARLRPAVKNIYAFARGADDIADEGSASNAERLAKLAAWQDALCQTERAPGEQAPDAATHAALSSAEKLIFARLHASMQEFQLPTQPFLDLLQAFKQDLTIKHYPSMASLKDDYCRYSANPVGRIMLQLFEQTDALALRQSDAICTGLQLTNFCQDVAIDNTKGRCYIPLDFLAHHGLQLADLDLLCRQRPRQLPFVWQAVMRRMLEEARSSLLAGAPLAWRLPGRIGLELRMVVHGGLRILEKLARQGYNPLIHRPIVGRGDAILLCWRAMCRPAMRARTKKQP